MKFAGEAAPTLIKEEDLKTDGVVFEDENVNNIASYNLNFV